MKTTKPFSTISYNSAEFLSSKLGDLIQKRSICFYAFVKHHREEDEKKDHIHLLIIPNGQIQTDAVSDLLIEMNSADPLKPFGVMPWRSSKFGDWYLYVSHDVGYLASKGQTRKYHYTEKDFVSSDEDYFLELIHTIDRTKYAKTQDFVQKVKAGASFLDMLQNGQIPAPQFNQWASMYEYIRTGTLYRAGRETHTPNVDPITGEYKDE